MRTWVAVVILLLALVVPAAQPTAAPSIWIASGEGAGDLAEALLAKGIEAHAYERLDMTAFYATSAVARAITDLGFRVHPNGVYPLHLDQSVPYIEADRVKDAIGQARTGPTVMVIDTGLDSTHPDFRSGNLAANVQPKRSQNGLIAGVTDQAPVVDRSGHGSHVAGIVAGSGEALGSSDPRHERFLGVYSNGRVASFQASTDNVDPTDIGVDVQAALEGFEWALQNQDRYDIRAITNSWGSAGDIVPSHPVAEASLKAYISGIVVLFSAGNDGKEGSLNKHCLPPWVLCIGAGDLDGTRASYSSMGNAPGSSLGAYDHPDLTAPGSVIRSANPLGGDTGGLLSGRSEPLYTDRSGTSMAAPHAAGVAGLLQAANPDLSPDQVMDILVSTTDPMSEDTYRVGSGYINARAAYNLAIQTAGTRSEFLQGTGIKYGGASTGDASYQNDPVTVGYDSDSGGDVDRRLLLEPESAPWVLRSPVAWVLLGLGTVFLLAGIRWRTPRPAPTRETPAA